jgi:hypothetical protein
MSTLGGIALLADDSLFRSRVKAAMITAGVAIAGEAVGGISTTRYQKRQQLARLVLNEPGTYLDRFAWAVASNTTVAGGVGAPILITSSTNANPTVITTATHGLSTGDVVEISGHLVNTNANGLWVVTVISSTTFSIPTPGNGVGGATGIVTKQPPDSDIQFTVNSDWDDIAGITATD